MKAAWNRRFVWRQCNKLLTWQDPCCRAISFPPPAAAAKKIGLSLFLVWFLFPTTCVIFTAFNELNDIYIFIKCPYPHPRENLKLKRNINSKDPYSTPKNDVLIFKSVSPKFSGIGIKALSCFDFKTKEQLDQMKVIKNAPPSHLAKNKSDKVQKRNPNGELYLWIL